MKIKKLFLQTIFIASMLIIAVGCGGSDDDTKEPEGTSILYAKSDYNSEATEIGINSGAGIFWISKDNNFISDGHFEFANIGAVSDGLKGITKISENGWERSTAVVPGNGYVIRYTDGGNVIYIRLHVQNWLLNSYNGIIGAVLKYQYPFVEGGK